VTAIRSMTRKADEARIRQEMAAAIAAYTGPVTKCPPGKARGGTGKVKLLIRPRYTPQRKPLKPRIHKYHGRPSRSVAILNPQAPRRDER
jgi:hypothetical protein